MGARIAGDNFTSLAATPAALGIFKLPVAGVLEFGRVHELLRRIIYLKGQV